MTDSEVIRDELNQLDEWLRSGVIDADKHRARKAELHKELSEATSSTETLKPKDWANAAVGLLIVGFFGFGFYSFAGWLFAGTEQKSARPAGAPISAPAARQVPDTNPPSADHSPLAFKIEGKTATIQGIGLGAGPDVCSRPMEQRQFGNHVGWGILQDAFVVNVCDINKGSDRTRVIFDETAKQVVAIERRLFIDHREIPIKDVIANAKGFYGQPDFEDPENWIATWGTAFADGRRHIWQRDSSGRGLIVNAQLCGMGGEDDECQLHRNKTVTVFFRIADLDAINRMWKAGSELANQKKQEAAKIDF